MKKVRACLDYAKFHIRTKFPRSNQQGDQAARELTWLREPELPLLDCEEDDSSEDGEEEEEDSSESSEREEVVPAGPLVVRSVSGKVVHSEEMAGDGMRVADIIENVCDKTEARTDEIRLLAGHSILENSMTLGKGQCISHPGPGKTLELSVAIVAGPPVMAASSSGSRIEVLDGVPECGEACHFDRDYKFTSLGDFAKLEGMCYVMTSNDDRKVSANRVMWQLDIREPAVVFVNFRSQSHLERGGAMAWLERDGWELKSAFKSTVSGGYPNGPYTGPVFAKSIQPQNRKYLLDLMGSNCWEGTYFVFVQMQSLVSYEH